MSRWFRFYDGALDDPKVQRLPAEMFKAWVNLLCLASRHDGKLPPQEDIGFALRLDDEALERTLAYLQGKGLLDVVGDALEPHNWGARQHKSDDSKERVQRYRERRKQGCNGDGNGDVTVTVTPPDTDTDTDTDKNSTPDGVEARAPAPKAEIVPLEAYATAAKSAKRGTRIPDDFAAPPEWIDFARKEGFHDDHAIHRLFDDFADYWRAKSGADACKLDWTATWRRWVRSQADRLSRTRPTSPSGYGGGGGSRLAAYQRAGARLSN